MDLGRVTSSPSILIVGAGALGLCAGFELKRRGHAVTVVDPGEANASLVAAGMIAPAMETAIDGLSADQAAVLRAGRDLWADFAAASGVALARRPAEWRGGEAEKIETRLRAVGFGATRDGDRVFTDEDGQIEPEQAVAALRAALGEALIEGRAVEIGRIGGGWRVRLEDQALEAERVVLATGAAAALDGTPAATRRLVEGVEPIRGQIGVTRQALADHVLRGPGAYVAPMGAGAVIGATMEPGRRDVAPDADTAARLSEAAWRVLGQAARPLDIDWRAGVRGASPDGLPMAGAGPDEGLFLALAPRRNGWLLGPMVGAVVADAIEGRAPRAEARALDPRRF